MPYKKNNPGCPCCGCECSKCSGGTPTTLTVEISGIAGTSCADCSSLNGTYSLAQTTELGCCLYRYYFDGDIGLPVGPCGATEVSALIGTLSGGNTMLLVELYINIGGARHRWRKDFGSTDAVACNSFSSENCPNISDIPAVPCIAALSTCLVSAP